jgi:hypothetical protein
MTFLTFTRAAHSLLVHPSMKAHLTPVASWMALLVAAATIACSSEVTPKNNDSSNPAPSGDPVSGDPASSTTTDPAAPAPAPAPTSAPESPCAEAGSAICARACGCATDGKCHVAVDTGSGAYGAVSFDDLAHCRQWYVDAACLDGGKAGFDYASCTADVKASACVDAAGGLRGVEFPSSCSVN